MDKSLAQKIDVTPYFEKHHAEEKRDRETFSYGGNNGWLKNKARVERTIFSGEQNSNYKTHSTTKFDCIKAPLME